MQNSRAWSTDHCGLCWSCSTRGAARRRIIYAARIIGYECHTRLTEARRASQSGQHGGVHVQQGISSSKCSCDMIANMMLRIFLMPARRHELTSAPACVASRHAARAQIRAIAPRSAAGRRRRGTRCGHIAQTHRDGTGIGRVIARTRAAPSRRRRPLVLAGQLRRSSSRLRCAPRRGPSSRARCPRRPPRRTRPSTWRRRRGRGRRAGR